MKNFRLVIVLLLCTAGISTAYGVEEFGRLFTTPKQRQQIDELRQSRSGLVIEVKDEELELDQTAVVEEDTRDRLVVKGLVYRSDGKNSAWVNDSNSYEGDLTSDFTIINSSGIHPDRVEIGLPGSDENIPLKVGQTFDPESMEVQDVVNDDDSDRTMLDQPDDT